MRISRLPNMVKGWFIGNFQPAVIQTNDFEAAVKEYQAGDVEKKHYHKIAQEVTVVIDGEVLMGGKNFQKGDIIHLAPGEATDFKALTAARTVVIKIPSVTGDKYFLKDS